MKVETKSDKCLRDGCGDAASVHYAPTQEMHGEVVVGPRMHCTRPGCPCKEMDDGSRPR